MPLDRSRGAVGLTRSAVLFVGDRDEDENAVKNAGVVFQWAHGFFADESS